MNGARLACAYIPSFIPMSSDVTDEKIDKKMVGFLIPFYFRSLEPIEKCSE